MRREALKRANLQERRINVSGKNINKAKQNKQTRTQTKQNFLTEFANKNKKLEVNGNNGMEEF